MTWTWVEVIRLALSASGVVGKGETVTAPDSQEGMDLLKLLLDEWDGIGLALPAFDIQVAFNTVANQAEYLLGAGSPNAYAVRPESILGVQVNISQSATPIWNVLSPLDFASYQQIPVPSVTSIPFNYSVNPTWPQMSLNLYPTPNAIYPLRVLSKVKWSTTINAPDLNPFAYAEVPSGSVHALIDNLALKLAMKNRLTTQELVNKAYNARYMLTSALINQGKNQQQPIGLMGAQIFLGGRNP